MIGWLVAPYLLLVGLAVAGSYGAWRLWRRHRLPFLRPYALYVSLCFAHALLNFIGEGFAPAVFPESSPAHVRVYALIDIGTIPLLAGIFLLLFLWVRDLLGREVSRGGMWLIVAIEVVFLSAFVGMVVAILGARPEEIEHAAGRGNLSVAVVGAVALNTILLAVAVLAVLVLRFVTPGAPEPYRRQVARGLGAVYAVSFAVVASFLLGPTLPFATRPGPGAAFLPTLVFLVNVPALIYLWRTLPGLSVEPANQPTDEEALVAFAEAAGISGRELEVVRLVVMGLDNRSIGEKLFISPKTVKNHITSVYAKAGARNRVQLTNLARRGGSAGDNRR